MKIALTAEQERLIQNMVDSGEFLSPSDVLDEAFALLRARERNCKEELADLSAKVQEGLDALRRGEAVSGEEVFDRLRRRGEERGCQQP